MARPRAHANDTERKRAHRQRVAETTTRVDRRALSELLAAVDAAAAAGDEIARRVRTGDPDGLLRNLAWEFTQRAKQGA
jgi:hypothetical protein